VAGFPDAVAAAVDAVPGVTGHVVYPDVVLAGACWAQWAGYPEPEQYLAGDVDVSVADWDVILALPAGGQAYAALAQQVPAVLRALSPLGELGPVTPTAIAVVAGGTVPGVTIRITQGG
jgi:hypothetical protein